MKHETYIKDDIKDALKTMWNKINLCKINIELLIYVTAAVFIVSGRDRVISLRQ